MRVSIKLTVTLLFLSMILNLSAQVDLGYADQIFLDNAVQYNEESGVRLNSGASNQSTSSQSSMNPLDRFKVIYYDDPNLVPSAEKEDEEEEEKKETKKKSFGFTFEQMAKKTTKSTNEQEGTENVQVKTRSFGFSFSDMAKIAQKPVSVNEDISSDNEKLNED